MNEPGTLQYHLDPVAFARDVLDFDADGPQSKVLQDPSGRIILCCTRQWGKSTTAAALAVHHMLFHSKPALVLVSSPVLRQSAELVRKAREFFHRAGIRTRGDAPHTCSLVLPSGARMIGLPGVTLLLIDEAAHVKDNTYYTVRPMLAVPLCQHD